MTTTERGEAMLNKTNVGRKVVRLSDGVSGVVESVRLFSYGAMAQVQLENGNTAILRMFDSKSNPNWKAEIKFTF